MKVEKKGHTVCIKDTQGDLVSFLMKVTHEYKSFEKHNIIIDISKYETLSVKEINIFMPLSKIHRNSRKSFVITTSNLDHNAVSTKLNVVRSLIEAHDIIEMDEIERDLGF